MLIRTLVIKVELHSAFFCQKWEAKGLVESTKTINVNVCSCFILNIFLKAIWIEDYASNIL